MEKYILMQAPKEYSEYSSQIAIVDISGVLGMESVKALACEGWTHVGRIESDLRMAELRDGFNHDMRKCAEKAQNLLDRIQDLAEVNIFI